MLLRSFNKRVPWQTWLKPWKQLDRWLLFLPMILTVVGGLLIRSTQIHDGWTNWLQHWTIGGIGLLLALLIARWHYTPLLRLHWLIYIITNLSLVAVMVVGTSALGAQRWIPILGFNVQPSEFAKVGLIISLAALLHHQPATTILSTVRALTVTLLPLSLVFLQPDLGTSLVFAAITLGMLYWANVNLGWLILMGSPLASALLLNVPLPHNLPLVLWVCWAVLMGVVGWLTLPKPMLGALSGLTINLIAGGMGRVVWNLLKDYQKDRIILFLDPDRDPLGGGYHLIQSRIAVGAGGLWGQGLHQGTQTQLNFIPEQHTDFIFSAAAEEFGFIGCMLLLLAFWLICVRLIRIALTANENFGSLICIGILSMLIFQVVLNISMNIGLAPVTGIPLPWLSYGRSALLTNFLAIGLVESIANHRKKRKFF